jgi:hypothetical protein
LFYCGYVPLVPLFWLRLPLLFFVFYTSVLVLSCLYCNGLLFHYYGYVPLVPLFWLRLPLLLFVFYTSVLVLSCLYCSGLLLPYCGYVPLVPSVLVTFAPAVLRFLQQRVGVVFFVWWTLMNTNKIRLHRNLADNNTKFINIKAHEK